MRNQFIFGGVDITGPHLHTIYPHGYTDTLPFATMGSGSLVAMPVFESRYREELIKKAEGIQLVTEYSMIWVVEAMLVSQNR
ncbi:proteasome subunit beta type-7-A-like [Ipomoea triloba]|uniref:proteasome subunit beta type-7-A-like n=1 Tax=Ipomoea triloba TaxID=35885 RepID=UPI00125DC15B|nr:proteasome subunit beta type-7-A-like [Ipomoea triloba]XP_031119899.1 proteasome subunit beta type-7-A-like [Ipomoea triloba]